MERSAGVMNHYGDTGSSEKGASATISLVKLVYGLLGEICEMIKGIGLENRYRRTLVFET